METRKLLKSNQEISRRPFQQDRKTISLGHQCLKLRKVKIVQGILLREMSEEKRKMINIIKKEKLKY